MLDTYCYTNLFPADLLKLCSVFFLLHGAEKQCSQIHFFPYAKCTFK